MKCLCRLRKVSIRGLGYIHYIWLVVCIINIYSFFFIIHSCFFSEIALHWRQLAKADFKKEIHKLHTNLIRFDSAIMNITDIDTNYTLAAMLA